jgi:hypothetical protein
MSMAHLPLLIQALAAAHVRTIHAASRGEQGRPVSLTATTALEAAVALLKTKPDPYNWSLSDHWTFAAAQNNAQRSISTPVPTHRDDEIPFDSA